MDDFFGYIRIHPKSCIGKIILKGLKVLLFFYFLNQKILVQMKLDVHLWSVRIKNLTIQTLWYIMHLLKKEFVEKYLCWYTHGESYIPYKTILEKMIDLIFSSSNIHEFADDNSNTYRSMIIDVIRMDHNYSGEGSHNILYMKNQM